MTIEQIRDAVLGITEEYHISKVVLFGSRACGTNRENSDIDLIVEFSVPVSLLTLSSLTCRLEEILKLDVDVIHGPIRKEDMIEVKDEVVLYAA